MNSEEEADFIAYMARMNALSKRVSDAINGAALDDAAITLAGICAFCIMRASTDTRDELKDRVAAAMRLIFEINEAEEELKGRMH